MRRLLSPAAVLLALVSAPIAMASPRSFEQLIAELDPSDFQLQVEEAAASLRRAEARVREICERYGLASFHYSVRSILDHGETLARQALARAKPGPDNKGAEAARAAVAGAEAARAVGGEASTGWPGPIARRTAFS